MSHAFIVQEVQLLQRYHALNSQTRSGLFTVTNFWHEERVFFNETLVHMFFRVCCSEMVSESLRICGLTHVETFVKELDAWNNDFVGDNRVSQLRSRSSNFLERFVVNPA